MLKPKPIPGNFKKLVKTKAKVSGLKVKAAKKRGQPVPYGGKKK